MNKLLVLLFGLVLATAVSAETHIRPINTATTINFKLYNADGTLDVDEVDGGTEVSLSCNEGAETTATNDFVDEGTFYSIALTQAEMNCARVAVVIAATTTEVTFIETYGASGSIPALPAVAAGASGGLPLGDASGFVGVQSGTGSGQISLSSGLLAWNPAWDAEVESEVDDSIGGGTGTALTAIPWNVAWDAEVQSEAADALDAENGANFTLVPWNAAWDAEVESEVDDSIGGGTGTALTAIPYNAAWDADIQSEANDAIVANHLNYLFLTTYDPAAKPGAADALLNELIESDAGVSQFTANALEDAPGGGAAGCAAAGGCSADGVLAGTHSSTTADLGLNAPGATSDLVGKTLDIPAKFFTRVITAYNTTTGVATFDTTTVTLADDDQWYLWDTAPGGALGTGSEFTAIPWNPAWDAEVESEVDDSLGSGTGTSLTAIPWNAAWEPEVESEVDDALGGGTGTALTAIPWNAAWDAEAQSEATDALNAYDPPTRAELTSDVDALPTAAENRAEMDSNSTDLNSLMLARTQILVATADSGDTNTLVDTELTFTNDVDIDGAYVVRSDGQRCFIDSFSAATDTIEFGACTFTGVWSTQAYKIYPANTQ